ncbi:ribonuclease H-like domain-containing protein [Tanacetum coccineum]
MALLVYVDDIVITRKCVDEINKFKVFLKSKFNIKDLSNLNYFLGIEVLKTRDDLCLSQKKYCLELLKEYGLLGCKPISTPMGPNSVMSYIPTSVNPLLDNITGYQKLLGKLIYLTHTRHDISYSVHCLAQYMHSPLKSYLNCALNVLRYLKNAPGKGIKYVHSDCENNLKEYRPMSSAACKIIWIQKLLYDINVKVTLSVDLFSDNKFALQLAVNPVFHERKAYLLEDKQIPNVGVFDEVTWIVAEDGVISIKRRRRNQSSDGVRIMATASGLADLKRI